MVPMIMSEMGLGAPEMDQDLGEAGLLRAMWIGCCCTSKAYVLMPWSLRWHFWEVGMTAPRTLQNTLRFKWFSLMPPAGSGRTLSSGGCIVMAESQHGTESSPVLALAVPTEPLIPMPYGKRESSPPE